MSMVRLTFALLLMCMMRPPVAESQWQPDPAQPRPPSLINASKSERLDAAIHIYLDVFISGIQRADTATLSALIPKETVSGSERAAAARGGCTSLASATRWLRVSHAPQSRTAAMPIGDLQLGSVAVTVATQGDTVARVTARVFEQGRGLIRYAPVEFVFVEAGDSWRVAAVNGVLAGLCGLARGR
jgi:hypothetical protein